MKISRRNYEKMKAVMYQKGFREGQDCGHKEMTDIFCNHIGILRNQVKNNHAAHNGLLHAQAAAEGFRLTVYHCDETPAEPMAKSAAAFQQRFYDTRRQDSLVLYREAFSDAPSPLHENTHNQATA